VGSDNETAFLNRTMQSSALGDFHLDKIIAKVSHKKRPLVKMNLT
jgi:hypothetical protein